MTPDPRLSSQQLLQYGIRLVQESQPEAARPFFEKVLERDPKNIPALMWLAGLGETAAISYRYIARALTIEPHNDRAHTAIRWNHWREQREKVHAAGAELDDRAPVGPPQAEPPQTSSTPAWLGAIAMLIVILGALASIYLGQPLPASATMAQAGPPAAVAQVLDATLPPLPTRTLPPAATATPTDIPAATPTLPPTLSPTETPLPSPTTTATAEPPTATPEPPTLEPVLPTATLEPAVINPTGSSGERWIDVDLSNQRLVAYEGDSPVYQVIVSTGLPGTPTVTGQYRIYVKYPAQTMSGPGYYLPDVPYVMYFYLGYGIHGTYWHNNFGQPMSHGCVNAPTPDAQWLYNWAEVGTLVNVHY
jgi:lipoprotein-anchoring transpeptidase ErfK/SrfK